MFASVFQALIVKPIFNLLVFIYAIIPGHNFGVAIIIFTIVVRFLMWPLVKKQLHQAKAMRELQPEIKRIKAATKGDRQKESQMLMELYKEREISPLGSIGTLIIQLIVLIGLYQGLRKVVEDPHAIYQLAYPFIQNMSWIKELTNNIAQFDATLFGVVDLTRPAMGPQGFYFPAFLIVLASAIAQYFQSKQLMPVDKDARGLRQILREAGSGKQSDQSEVNAAIGRSTRYFLPIMIFFFTIGIASALSLYWLVGGVTAYFQQDRILKQDEKELENSGGKTSRATKKEKTIIEGEVIENPKNKKAKSGKKKASKNAKKRRKK